MISTLTRYRSPGQVENSHFPPKEILAIEAVTDTLPDQVDARKEILKCAQAPIYQHNFSQAWPGKLI